MRIIQRSILWLAVATAILDQAGPAVGWIAADSYQAWHDIGSHIFGELAILWIVLEELQRKPVFVEQHKTEHTGNVAPLVPTGQTDQGSKTS